MNFTIRSYILLFFLIIICGYLLYHTNEEIKSNTIEQVSNEQLVHATQAENNLIALFDNYNSSLFFLADNVNIKNQNAEGNALMRIFFQTHQSDISSITRVDEGGRILYSYPNESITGSDISDQMHVQQIIRSREKVISDVFTAVQGYRAVAMHVPVFSGGEYTGSIALLIPFDVLARQSLEKIRLKDTGYAWAVSKGGIILYSPYSEQIDKKAGTVFNSYPSVLAFVKKAQSGREGTGYYLYSPPGSPGNTMWKYHAVYRLIDIGDQSWSIIIATPEKEIFSSLQTFTRDLSVLSAIILVSLLIFAYYSSRALKIVQEEETRKKVESALRESEKNYRMIFDSIQDVFFRSDKQGRLVMISPSGISLLGYDSADEILGKNLTDFLIPDQKEQSNLIKILEGTSSVKNHEVTVRTKQGGIIYALTSSHLHYNDAGEVMGIEGIIHDITNEKMTRNALGQALKKLNLLNSITFTDIQNSIFSLSGYLEISRSMIQDPVVQEMVEKEEGITHSILKALNFAKDYQGLGMTPPSWQNVQQVFLYGISHTDTSSYARALKIQDIEIFADPLLEKVFSILADNVITHGKKATEITIEHRFTENGMIISFADNGVGIPDSDKEKVFEWKDGHHKKNGLFLAREILGITNITIRETGIPGEGACFEIVIPKDSFRFYEPMTGNEMQQ